MKNYRLPYEVRDDHDVQCLMTLLSERKRQTTFLNVTMSHKERSIHC